MTVFILKLSCTILCNNPQKHKRILHFHDPLIPEIHLVDEECNMIDFAKKFVKDYDPDSGMGYYELTDGTEEYISHTTGVILISKVHLHVYQ